MLGGEGLSMMGFRKIEFIMVLGLIFMVSLILLMGVRNGQDKKLGW